MLQIAYFAFNAFQENTYIVHDETNECLIIDPGCYTNGEKQKLTNYIQHYKLTPVTIVNTHCHLDHILGNNFVSKHYNLPITAHKIENDMMLPLAAQFAKMSRIKYEESPQITKFIDENNTLKVGNTTAKILFTPGHSPGSISLYFETDNLVICGDVLFKGSIGRTDLPFGNTQLLEKSIKNQLLTLPKTTKVFSGHGEPTTIEHEINYNPFLA